MKNTLTLETLAKVPEEIAGWRCGLRDGLACSSGSQGRTMGPPGQPLQLDMMKFLCYQVLVVALQSIKSSRKKQMHSKQTNIIYEIMSVLNHIQKNVCNKLLIAAFSTWVQHLPI